MKVIKVATDFRTGRRAGGITALSTKVPGTMEYVHRMPTDPLWQNVEGGYELRVVEDSEIRQFYGVKGITVIDDDATLETELKIIADKCDDQYAIWSEPLFVESLKQSGHDLSEFAGLTHSEVAEKAYALKCAGIIRRKRQQPSIEVMKMRCCNNCEMLGDLGKHKHKVKK